MLGEGGQQVLLSGGPPPPLHCPNLGRVRPLLLSLCCSCSVTCLRRRPLGQVGANPGCAAALPGLAPTPRLCYEGGGGLPFLA